MTGPGGGGSGGGGSRDRGSLSSHSADRSGGPISGYQTNISGHGGHSHVGRGRTQAEADANAHRDYQRDHGRDE